MITVRQADLTTIEADAIVNAANGVGTLGGGVAGAIRRAGGQTIEAEALQRVREHGGPFPRGSVYVTGAGRLPARWVLHAVTMVQPAEPADLDSVRRCVREVVRTARRLGARTVAMPALGTGVGGLAKEDVARVYAEELRHVDDLDIVVCDVDGVFTGALSRILREQEQEGD